NRRWWILVIAVALAVVLNIVNSIFNQTLAAQLAGGVVVTVVVQALWLAATFGVLGLCHLLGRVRGGTVPMPVQPAPIPQQGDAPAIRCATASAVGPLHPIPAESVAAEIRTMVAASSVESDEKESGEAHTSERGNRCCYSSSPVKHCSGSSCWPESVSGTCCDG